MGEIDYKSFGQKKEARLKMHEKKVAFVQRHMFGGYGLYEKKNRNDLISKGTVNFHECQDHI
jgi:TfoX/Sxy family transcriptional regulator of competence genes